MATVYTYSVASDFAAADAIEPYLLAQGIATAVGVTPESVGVNGDAVTVVTPSALSEGQKAAMDAYVAGYVYAETVTPPFVYDAIVSTDPLADAEYSSIAAAFAAGHINVFVRRGTYVETADIAIPDRGQLIGESPGTVFIILVAGAKIVMDAVAASGGAYETTGTVSIASGTSTVTGVGTTFTNLSAGQFIMIGTNYFPIAAITDDTSLTVADVYNGETVAGEPLLAHAVYSGNRISNLILYGATAEALNIRGFRNGAIDCVAIYSCGAGIVLKDAADLSISSVVVNYCGGVGFLIDMCRSLSLNIVNVYNNGAAGYVINASRDVNLETSTSESNAGAGIEVTGASESVNITDGIVKWNTGAGISVASPAKYVSITSLNCHRNGGNGVTFGGSNLAISEGFIYNNGGHGIELGAAAEEVLIGQNCINFNTSAGVYVGTSASCVQIMGNVFKGNAEGVNATTLVKSVISGNHVEDCTIGNGIEIGGASTRVTLSDNIIYSNAGGKGVVVGGTTSHMIINSNQIFDNATASVELGAGVSSCVVTANILSVAADTAAATNVTAANNIVA